MAIRYKKPLGNVPDLCDGCSSQFSLLHTLSCTKDVIVIQIHNKIQDAIEDHASLVLSQVKHESFMREADTKIDTPALITYLAVCGRLKSFLKELVRVCHLNGIKVIYSEATGWVRTRMLFAILRSSILCLRESHMKWRCLGLEDGEHPLAYH